MKNTEKDKLLWLQAARGVAAMLVLLYHAGAMAWNSPQGPFFFGHAGVDLFFVISGYIIYRAHRGEVGEPAALPRFLYRRLTRIYPPYWVATCLILAGAMVFPGLVEPGKMEIRAIVESYLLFPVDGQKYYPLLPVGWSLFYEMAFYTGFILLFVIPKRGTLILLVFWTVMAGWFMQVDGVTKGRSVLHGFPHFFTGLPVLEFLAGVALARITSVPGKIWFWSVASALILLLAGLVDGIWGRNIMVSLGYAGGMWSLVVLSCVLDQAGKIRPPQWLAGWGDRSYSLYLAHFPVVMGIDLLLERGDFGNAPVFSFVLLFIAGAASGWLFYRVVEKPLLDLARTGHHRWFSHRKSNPAFPP